jgi:hypothetical protein
MSHIDTYRVARPTLGTVNRPEAGIVRARTPELPPIQGRRDMQETLPERSPLAPAQGQELESVLAVSAPDLERLEGMTREQMFAQLVHIEHGLMAKVSATPDPDLRLSLETGLQMIQETIRRLHLINNGVAALVVK